MSYYNYFLSYLLIFICLFLEIESFTPTGRLAHSSVLAGNKLYFFGGVKDTGLSTNEVFYLDVSQPLNMEVPPWNDLTPSAGLPFRSSWGTVSLSDINNEQTIYLFGGHSRDLTESKDNFKSIIHSFNLNSLTWNIPVAKGKLPERRKLMKSVIDKTGKIYIFGGYTDSFLGSPVKYLNDMAIFNIVESSWSISVSPIGARSSYTATLLSNGVIVYIGGSEYITNTKIVDISQISLYDTKSLTWTNKVAKLIDPIDSRRYHTAVLAPNGKIVIHGGSKRIVGNTNVQVTPDLAVLNTETEPFEWTAPLVSSNIGKVPSLSVHTANLVENYMIVAFGNITQPNGPPLDNSNSKIYLLDIRSYTWVDTFEPSTSNVTSSNPSTPSNPTMTNNPSQTSTNTNASESNNQLTTMKVVIGTLSGVLGTAILMTIGFFGYRWHKKRQTEQIEGQDGVLRIYGNHGNTY